MRPVLLLFISILLVSCSTKTQGEKNSAEVKETSRNSIKEPDKPVVAPTPNIHNVEEVVEAEVLPVNGGCTCIDYMFSQKGKMPLLEKTIGSHDIIVCGYSGEYEDGIPLGTINKDSSFYASGFVVFDCSGESLKSIFSDGEYYLDIIRPEAHQLKINRLIRVPQDGSLEYKWMPIISINIDLEDESTRIDSSFIFPIENYSDEFLESFKMEIGLLKDVPNKELEYEDYLITYSFIQAIKHPNKYSDELKSIGPFDGYLGPIYRDLLIYYSVFEKETTGV